MRQSKRAQSALEFLTTYGWAFLVILIMIGALAYFGVLDPGRFLPPKCQFPAGVSCQETNFAPSGAADAKVISMSLLNNFGKRVELGTPTVIVTGAACPSPLIGFDSIAGNSWEPNQLKKLTISCGNNAVKAGDRPTADVIIEYTESGSTLGSKKISGVVSGRVN